MKLRLLALAVLLLVAAVLGQIVGDGEDFEDDTIGENPTSSLYTYTETGPATVSNVVSGGLDGTSQSYRIDCRESGCGSTVSYFRFLFTANEQVDLMTFYTNHNTGGGGARNNLYLQDEDGRAIWAVEARDFSGTWPWYFTDANDIPAISGCSGTRGTASGLPTTGPNFWSIAFDWGAKTTTTTIVNGGTTYVDEVVLPFCDSSATGLGRLSFCGSPHDCDFNLDQIAFNGGPPVGVEPFTGAEEFDTGFIATIEGFGFISAQSKYLFGLGLVGLGMVATASSTKWLAPSRFKNYSILGAAALIGVFLVLMAFWEMWAWIVCFMIGVFAVRGTQEARNTFFEIRDALRPEVDEDVLLGGSIRSFNAEIDRIFEQLEDEENDDKEPSKGFFEPNGSLSP